MNLLKMTDCPLTNKRLLIREDFNVPIVNGQITSDARIVAALPTIRAALAQQAAVILLSHLGRPKSGHPSPEFSLEIVARRLQDLLHQPVRFVPDWINGFDIKPGEVVLCENVRFLAGEEENDPALSKKMAALGDIFVMDAFATAHRAQASTVGIARYIPCACAGPLLVAELEALNKIVAHPKKPLLAIVGGAKVSSKLQVIESLLDKVDGLILGGGIANTFLAAQGFSIGNSLYEAELIPTAKTIMEKAAKKQVSLYLPKDVRVADTFSAEAPARIQSIDAIAPHDMILDIGPKTEADYAKHIQDAGTLFWNGPVGVFEFPAFASGTRALALAIASSPAYSVAGGGDTLSAIDAFGVEKEISYISTGGGALLEWIEGKSLPAISALEACAKQQGS